MLHFGVIQAQVWVNGCHTPSSRPSPLHLHTAQEQLTPKQTDRITAEDTYILPQQNGSLEPLPRSMALREGVLPQSWASFASEVCCEAQGGL